MNKSFISIEYKVSCFIFCRQSYGKWLNIMLSWCPSIKEPRQVVNCFSMLYKPSRHGIEPTRRIQKGQYLATNLDHIEVIWFKFHWVLGGVFGWLGRVVPLKQVKGGASYPFLGRNVSVYGSREEKLEWFWGTWCYAHMWKEPTMVWLITRHYPVT